MIPQNPAPVTPTRDCLWWCVGDHIGESAGARLHWCPAPQMPLTLDSPRGKETLLADLTMDESDGRGLVVELGSIMGGGWDLTPDEADRLADTLRMLAATARVAARGLVSDQIASRAVQNVVALGGEVL